MLNDYSKEALLKFMDYLANKGIMNKTTARSRKASCNKMLSILDDSESSDLRLIKLNDVAIRFANLKGTNYTPKTLQVYKSRVAKALSDFLRYKENPENFSIETKSGRAAAKGASITTPVIDARQPATPTSKGPNTDFNTFDIPIHLRPGVVVQLNGLPADLTTNEAKKISNVVLANVVITPYTEGES